MYEYPSPMKLLPYSYDPVWNLQIVNLGAIANSMHDVRVDITTPPRLLFFNKQGAHGRGYP